MIQFWAILECRKASMLCLLVPVATTNVRWCWNTISTSCECSSSTTISILHVYMMIVCFVLKKKNIWLLFVMHTNVYRYIYTMCVPRYPLQLSGVTSGVNSFIFFGLGIKWFIFQTSKGIEPHHLTPTHTLDPFLGLLQKKKKLSSIYI